MPTQAVESHNWLDLHICATNLYQMIEKQEIVLLFEIGMLPQAWLVGKFPKFQMEMINQNTLLIILFPMQAAPPGKTDDSLPTFANFCQEFLICFERIWQLMIQKDASNHSKWES